MLPRIIVVLTCSLLLPGCSTLMYNTDQEQSVSSSLVDFLYPEGKQRINHEHDIPVIQLPVNLGIAFVPSNNWRSTLDEKTQMELLKSLKDGFAQQEYIQRIELIPESYLRQGQGFSTLKQVARMHDIDVMALVSYDQLIRNYEKEASLLYWTIVGMYIVQGNENNTQTFVDTAVFDVHTEKLLFRAPGASSSRDRIRAVELNQASDENSRAGFETAFASMSKNLNTELAQFEERVKQERIVRIERRPGYSGGSMQFLFCVFLLGIIHLRKHNTWNIHMGFSYIMSETITYRSDGHDPTHQ